MPKSKSSKRWLHEHHQDIFVKRSKQEGYRARAAYKLLEIQQTEKIIKQGMYIVDLGSAPGSWSQVAANIIGEKGHIIAVDLLPMAPIKNVDFIQGDFINQEILDKLVQMLNQQKVDLVISDLAPNISGIKSADQYRMLQLANAVLAFAVKILKPNGTLLIKLFQGEGCAEFRQNLARHFKSIKVSKPKASRDRSQEFYLLAKGFA